MLVDVGRNLVRPVHEAVIRVGALEEGMLIPTRIDGRLQGVFVPLKDVGTEELPHLLLVGSGVLRCDLLGGLNPVHIAGSIPLGALLPLDGADLLANVVPGLDVQLVGALWGCRLW